MARCFHSFVLLIFLRGMKIAMHARDELGRLLAMGITATITLYALINRRGVTSGYCDHGASHAVLSYGGTAMLITCAASGVAVEHFHAPTSHPRLSAVLRGIRLWSPCGVAPGSRRDGRAAPDTGICRGGTGGHLYPALRRRDHAPASRWPLSCSWGAEGKIEIAGCAGRGYPLLTIWISGFRRRLSAGTLLYPSQGVCCASPVSLILWRKKPTL